MQWDFANALQRAKKDPGESLILSDLAGLLLVGGAGF